MLSILNKKEPERINLHSVDTWKNPDDLTINRVVINYYPALLCLRILILNGKNVLCQRKIPTLKAIEIFKMFEWNMDRLIDHVYTTKDENDKYEIKVADPT